MPFVGPLNEYKAPLTGHEKRLSGLQRMQQSLFEKNNTKHVKTLRSMKAHVDTTAPVRKYKHIPRHEHPATLVRQKEIAAENIRLLHKMTKSLVVLRRSLCMAPSTRGTMHRYTIK